MANYINQGTEAIENVANNVIKEHFSSAMANLNIAYRFREKAKVTKGHTILVEPKKVTGLLSSFTDADLILVAGQDYWHKFDNKKKRAAIHEALLQVDLEPKPSSGNFPAQISKTDERFQLSNGDIVEGRREAYRREEELCAHEISLLAYNEEIIAENIDKFGCWRNSLQKLKESFVQMKLTEKDGPHLKAVE